MTPLTQIHSLQKEIFNDIFWHFGTFSTFLRIGIVKITKHISFSFKLFKKKKMKRTYAFIYITYRGFFLLIIHVSPSVCRPV